MGSLSIKVMPFHTGSATFACGNIEIFYGLFDTVLFSATFKIKMHMIKFLTTDARAEPLKYIT